MKRLIVLLLVLLVSVICGGNPAWARVSKAELQEINQSWKNSAHALADVNCSSCHQDKKAKAVVVQPSHESCRSCHEAQVDTFLLGKHGIRLQEGQSPLTPAMAQLPMKPTAHDRLMNCNTCHDAHSVNTVQASMDSCLTCHNDTHSLNYKNSKHAELFLVESSLTRPSSKAVSCATCHLPRQKPDQSDEGTVFVNHNNTFNLLPRDRMVSDVCMNCHGMEYSYNSIFDDALVESNFDRPPSQQLETLNMVRALDKKRVSKTSDES